MTPYFIEDRKRWALDVPAKFDPDGKRKRMFFKTEDEALEEAETLENQKEVKSLGIPVMGANARARFQALVDKAGGLDELEALVHQALTQRPARSIKTVDAAIEAFLKEKEFQGVGNLQQISLKSQLKHFQTTFGKKTLPSLGVAQVSNWLQNFKGVDSDGKDVELSPMTKRNVYRAVHQFIGFCERREWINRNIMKSVGTPRIDNPKKSILTPTQFQAMIDGVIGEELVFLALGGLAGLRTAEIVGNDDHGGMKWDWIDFERGEILVHKDVTKKRRERIVPMCPSLKSILKRYKGDGLCVSFNDSKAMTAMRDKFVKLAKLKEWPDNCLRHSFASYDLALNEDAAKTSLKIGHKDADTTHRHYARLVKKEDAVLWFNTKRS